MTVSEHIYCLRMMERTLPEGWELVYTGTDWRVYNPDGAYYGDHHTPEEAIKSAINHIYTLSKNTSRTKY